MTSPYLAVSQMFGSRDSFYAIPSVGARYTDHSEFDSQFGPQAGLILGYRDTEFHASYARGFNYPGVFVKANDVLFLPGDNRWQDLNAERVNHFEVGLSHKFKDFARVDATWFMDDGKDRIVVDPPPPFPPTWTNLGRFKNKGMEATITLTPWRDLSFFAGATYLDSSPEDLPYAPEWTASFGLNYRFLRDFQLSIDGIYVDEHFVTSRARRVGTLNVDKVDSAFVLNGKLTYDFVIPCPRMNVQLFAAAENLTDADYEQKRGYPMPGISGMGGFKLRF